MLSLHSVRSWRIVRRHVAARLSHMVGQLDDFGMSSVGGLGCLD